VKFVDNGMLARLPKCNRVLVLFVTHPHEIAKHFVCGLATRRNAAGRGKGGGIAVPRPLTQTRQPRRWACRLPSGS